MCKCKICERENKLGSKTDKIKRIISRTEKNSDYDVLIGVSGGKDSYFQADLAIIFLD